MRVLIFEPDHHGHRLPYVRAMAPEFLSLSAEVTVATRQAVLGSPEFRLHLAGAPGISVDAWMPPPPSGLVAGARAKLDLLRKSIARAKPDFLYVPSGDGLAQMLGVARYLGRDPVGRGVHSEALLLRGGFAYPQPTATARMKARVSWAAARKASWSFVYHLDPIVYERIEGRGDGFARRCALMPDPVESPGPVDRDAVLSDFGVPPECRCVGSAGVMDRRKGIDLLLRAFAQAELPDTDRLLLVGPQEPFVRSLIAAEFKPLVDAGRIVTHDEVVPSDRMASVIAAMDVVCTPYPRHIGSASIIIRAAAAGRPVLSTDFGWMRMAVSRFGLGWTCDTSNPEAFATALRAALDRAADFRRPPAADRFVEFHTPANFSATWVSQMRRTLNLPPLPYQRNWDWVLHGEGAAGASPS